MLGKVDAFQDWLAVNRLTPARKADLNRALAQGAGRLPAISVVMPVYRPDIALLDAAVESVRSQVHGDWELCLCDDGSGDAGLTAWLASLAVKDARIRVTSLPSNAGISAATNAAAELANGDVLIFLDQDDLLAPDCLAEFALAFAADPELDLAYSDGDKIDMAGRRHAPAFKPGWSPTLLLSYMYLGHAVAIRSALFRRLGGMRSAFDGSQDYDLALRASEAARRIGHIPLILYHWRTVPGSTAVSAAAKPRSIEAGRQAVAEAVQRRAIAASVIQPDWAKAAGIGLFQLEFAESRRPVAVVVFADREAAIDTAWLSSLSLTESPLIKIIQMARDDAPLGIRLALLSPELSGLDVVLLRAGTQLPDKGWLRQLLGHAGMPGAGMAGARIVGSGGRVVSAGMVRPTGGDQVEQGFAGLDQERGGANYLARVARECLGIPAVCIALESSFVPALAALPPQCDDLAELGLDLASQVRTRGGQCIGIGSLSAVIGQHSVGPACLLSNIEDPSTNRNLGAGDWQFRPARRGPRAHAPQALRLAVHSHNLDREGAQLMLLDLLTGLRMRGAAIPVLFSPRGGALRADFEAAGIPVHIVGGTGRRARARRLDRFSDDLAQVYHRHGFDVVLANTLECHGAVAAAASAGLPAVWWQHEGGPWHAYLRRLPLSARARLLAAFAQAYKVVQVAEATRRDWLPIAARANFQVIRNQLSDAIVDDMLGRWSRATARARLGLGDEECAFVMVGSVSARKGQADAIVAMAALKPQIADRARLFVVGNFVDRTYCAELLNSVQRLPESLKGRIELVGGSDDPSLYYAACDAFVCCSRQESAPRAIVEAMHFGLPVATTPVDGIPELVRFGVDALSYGPGQVSSLAEIMENLATSPAERFRLGQNAKERVRALQANGGMVGQFLDLLQEAALTRGRGCEPEVSEGA